MGPVILINPGGLNVGDACFGGSSFANVLRLVLVCHGFFLFFFCFLCRSVEMGHSSQSLGLHGGKEPGQLSEACSQQNPKLQGRLKQF